ncbi:MAG: 4-hydroxy-3-methylbut-2-enyl diphosphate reductase [Desulfococcaceae bacterium]|jgi:4-hydroxy-3-methylbut-2-enyl diphosphate reductase|nr:4-hydroxy-3-methylbut-2-enyl diphosphate reductase [Desulfococcaceae bacterium]
MKISVAHTAGFCMGVQRAVEMALDASNTCHPPIYTYGPLIHNPQVLSLMEDKGIRVLREIPEQGKGTVIIRAHGIPLQTREKLEKAGFCVIDATCPRVIKVQTIIRKHAARGAACIIIGDKDHPEVIGLLGYAGKKGFVADSLQELEEMPAFEDAIIVAQTTQNILFYESVKKWAEQKCPHYQIFNTICDSTEKRQAEAKRLAQSVDLVVVVGGHESGNTRRLAQVVRENGKRAFHVETEGEIDVEALAAAAHIGITAGASTPNWIIKRIYRAIESLPFEKQSVWRKRRLALQRFLIRTNICVALGAAALCYACTVLQEIASPFPYIVITLFYVLSMHTLNNLTGIREARYNDPDRSSFYDNHKIALTLLAISSGGIGLGVAAGVGMLPFLLLFAMSILGLCYNLKIIPESAKGFRYRRIRDIPGSKTILISLAWGVVIGIFPVLAVWNSFRLSTMPVFVLAMSMAFVRAAFFDVLDMQGDRIMGKETIPLLLGEKLSITFLKGLCLFIMLILFLTGAYEVFSGLSYGLILCPFFLLLIISTHKKGRVLPGIRLEFLVESQFVLSGLITLLWVLIAA